MPSLSGKVSALPTEEVIAFPFGEGGGFADGRDHCLPFWGRWRLCRRKRSLPSLLGKVAALPTEEVFAAGSVPTWRTMPVKNNPNHGLMMLSFIIN